MAAGHDATVKKNVVEWHTEAIVSPQAAESAQLAFAQSLINAELIDGQPVHDANGHLTGVMINPRHEHVRFTVRMPRSEALVAPLLVMDPAQRVVIHGAAFTPAIGLGVRKFMGYRLGSGTTKISRTQCDLLLMDPVSHAEMPIYLKVDSLRNGPIGTLNSQQKQGMMMIAAALFVALLIALGLIYRRLARKARWEKTEVRLDAIRKEGVPS